MGNNKTYISTFITGFAELIPSSLENYLKPKYTEIEQILDTILPSFIPEDRLITVRASEITERFDWGSLIERLVGLPEEAENVVAQPVPLIPTLWD